MNPEDAIVAALWNLFRVVAFAVLVFETGRALVARFDSASRGLERRLIGAIAGFVALAGIPFVLALTCLVFVRWWLIVAVAAAIVIRFRREWLEERRARDRRGLTRFERGVVATGLAVFFVYALRYEASHFYYGCLHSSVAWAIGEPIGHLATTPIEKILFFHQDAQIGGTAIVAPFAAMIGPLGERVLLGFAPCAIFFLSVLTLRRMFHERTALAASLMLVMCPWLLRLPQISVNTLAWLAGAALVFLITHRRVGWLAGFVAGFYVGVLYINVLAVPVLAWWAYRNSDRVRLRRFLAGLAIVGLVLLVQNIAGHGHPLSYGSFRTVAETGRGPFRYSIFGIEFFAHALFNWPLFDRVVRTPMNPMPVFLLLPVLGLRFFGLLISGVFLLGLRRLRETDRVAFAASVAWAAIVAGVLLVQENWLQVEKAHTPFDLLPALTLMLGAGIERMREERWKTWAAQYAVAIATLAAFAWWAPRWNVPVDTRFFELFTRFARNEGTYLDAEREPYAWPRLLPDFSEIPAAFRAGVGRRLVRDLSVAHFEDRPESARETMLRAMIPAVYYGFMMPRGALDRTILNRASWTPPPGAPAWSLDLTGAPVGSASPVKPHSESVDSLVMGEDLPVRWTAPPVTWSDRPIDVVAFVDEGELFFVLTRPLDERIERFERAFGELQDKEAKLPGERPWETAPMRIASRAWPDAKARLVFRALPGAMVNVIDALYLDPSRIYWRRIELGSDGVRDRGRLYWHAN